jgi:hypothetical protein
MHKIKKKVKYCNLELNENKSSYKKVEGGKGVFLSFGIKNNESSVLIKLDNGNIKNVNAELVTFID